MSFPNFNKLNDNIRNQLAIAWRSEVKPSRIYLAKESKGITIASWQEAISNFTTSPEGLSHLENNKLKAFRSLNPGELNNVRAQAEAALTYLNKTPAETRP